VAEREGFDVKVIPRSRRDEVAGERDGRLLLRVRSAPESGRANEAVRRLIAAGLGIPVGDVELLRGAGSRLKTIRVAGLTAAEARRRLLAG
jgi:uncharacterized protein YggU (UPF0235/DUF167 family)